MFFVRNHFASMHVSVSVVVISVLHIAFRKCSGK